MGRVAKCGVVVATTVVGVVLGELLVEAMATGGWVVLFIVAVLAAPIYLVWALVLWKPWRAVRACVFAVVVCFVVISPVSVVASRPVRLPLGSRQLDASASRFALLNGQLPVWFKLRSRTTDELYTEEPDQQYLNVDSSVAGALFSRGQANDASCVGPCVLVSRGTPPSEFATTQYALWRSGDRFYVTARGGETGSWQLQPILNPGALFYWAIIAVLMGGLLLRALLSRRSADIAESWQRRREADEEDRDLGPRIREALGATGRGADDATDRQ